MWAGEVLWPDKRVLLFAMPQESGQSAGVEGWNLAMSHCSKDPGS